MPTMKRRNGPTAEQAAYIDRISNPRTPEDLLLALQNPSTPAYKQMMNMLIASIDTYLIIERLIERFVYNEAKAIQLEKDEIYQRHIEQAMAAEARMRREVPRLVDVFERHSLANSDIGVVKKLWEHSIQQGKTLASRAATLQAQLVAINQAQSKNTAAWSAATQAQAKGTVNLLAQNGQSFYVRDAATGQFVALNANQTEAMLISTTPPEPVKLVDILSQSYLFDAGSSSASTVDVAGENVTPVATRPFEKVTVLTPEVILGRGQVAQSLAIIGKSTQELPGDADLVKIIFEALNKNKLAVKFLNVQPSEEKLTLLKDAIEISQKKHKTHFSLDKVHYDQAENAKATRRYAAQYETLSKQSHQPSNWPPRPKPRGIKSKD